MGSVLLTREEIGKAGNPVTFDKSAYRIKLHSDHAAGGGVVLKFA